MRRATRRTRRLRSIYLSDQKPFVNCGRAFQRQGRSPASRFSRLHLDPRNVITWADPSSECVVYPDGGLGVPSPISLLQCSLEGLNQSCVSVDRVIKRRRKSSKHLKRPFTAARRIVECNGNIGNENNNECKLYWLVPPFDTLHSLDSLAQLPVRWETAMRGQDRCFGVCLSILGGYRVASRNTIPGRTSYRVRRVCSNWSQWLNTGYKHGNYLSILSVERPIFFVFRKISSPQDLWVYICESSSLISATSKISVGKYIRVVACIFSSLHTPWDAHG